MGYGLVPGLQCHRVHAGSREGFFIRSLHGLSHWKKARGNEGSMWGGFQGVPYTGKNQLASPKIPFSMLPHISA